MPASTSCVTLEQAKDWSKRLLKTTPAIGKLADAQASVALMLGHASWHALQAYYKRQEPILESTTPHEADEEMHIFGEAIDGPQAKDTNWDGPWVPDFSASKPPKSDPLGLNRYVGVLNSQYPGLNAAYVEMVGSQVEMIGSNREDVLAFAEQMQYAEGMSFREAVEQVMERCSYPLHAPPEHFLVRVVDAKNQRTMAVMPYEKRS